jgi:Uncharacterized protein conserved in bacteria
MKYYSKNTNAALTVWWFSTICPRIPSCCGNNLPTAFLFPPPSVVQEHVPSSSFLRTKTFLTTNSLTTTDATTSGSTNCNPYQIRNGRIRSIRLYGKRGGSTSSAGSGKSKDKQQPSRRISKSNLPEKICVVCNRPFTWRKKWERCWDEVTCCSKSCNAKRRGNASSKD